jgi:hypothetical protein
MSVVNWVSEVLPSRWSDIIIAESCNCYDVAAEHAICVNRINGDELVSTYLSDCVPAFLDYGNTTGFSNAAF